MMPAAAVVSRVFDVWEVKEEGEKNPEYYLVDVEIYCDGFYRNALLKRPTWYAAFTVSPGDDVRELQ